MTLEALTQKVEKKLLKAKPLTAKELATRVDPSFSSGRAISKSLDILTRGGRCIKQPGRTPTYTKIAA